MVSILLISSSGLFPLLLWILPRAPTTTIIIIVIIIIIIIIILLLFWEFFPSALADGFSLEYEWQQVSSSLQDSSQYFGRS